MNPVLDKLRQPAMLGLLGALLIYVALGTLNALGVPLFAPDDEARHAAYGLILAQGRIPLVDEVMPTDELGIEPLARTNIVCSANHPPLYYALIGFPLRLGSEAEMVPLAMYVSRLLTLGMGLVGVAYVFALLRKLAPERPAVAILGTSFLALFPNFVNFTSIVHNDALAFLSSTALLYHVVASLGGKPRTADAIGFLVWACVVGLTRFSGVLVLGPALVGMTLAHGLYGEGPPSRRWVYGVSLSAAALVAVLLTSGWFYWRNYALYGDITGAQEIFDTLERKTKEPAWVYFFTGDPWWRLHDHLWTQLTGARFFDEGADWLPRFFTVTAVVGLVVAIVRAVLGGTWPHWKDGRLWAIGLGLLTICAVTLPTFEFHARGGNIYPRYYFPAVWIVCYVAAEGFLAFRSTVVAKAGLGYALVLFGLMYSLYGEALWRLHASKGALGREQVREISWGRLLDLNGIDGGWMILAGVAIAVAVGVALVAHALSDRKSDEIPTRR